jgi:uncharacterized membrane protein YsdA (DUF1294 family)
MPDHIVTYIGIYLVAVSLLAIGLTLCDKRAAQRGSWRIKERTLLLVSVFGGSAAMLVTMRFIRHKTKHVKFMMGIPVIIVLQAAAFIFAWLRLSGK